MCRSRTQSQRKADWFRRTILIVGMLYVVGAVGWIFSPLIGEDFAGVIGTPLAVFEGNTRGEYAYLAAGVIGAILLAQWAFLRPRQGWRPQLLATGRPMRSAIIAASAMAMLLTTGAITLVLEIPIRREGLLEEGMNVPWMWGTMLVVWAFWAWVFFVYWRQGDRYTQLGRMIRALVAGSFLEAIVAIPAHILVMRQSDCYCARGTYTALVFAGLVLLWAFGPGIILLYMRESHRRMRLEPICSSCTYSLRGLPLRSERCPECGEPFSDWNRELLSSTS